MTSICFASKLALEPGLRGYLLPIAQATGDGDVTLKTSRGDTNVRGTTWANHGTHAFWVPAGGFLEAIFDQGETFTLVDTGTNRIRVMALVKDLLTYGRPGRGGFDITTELSNCFPDVVKAAGGARGKRAIVSFEPDLVFGQGLAFAEIVAVSKFIYEKAMQGEIFFYDELSESARRFSFALLSAPAFEGLIARAQMPLDLDEEDIRAVKPGSEGPHREQWLGRLGPQAKQMLSTMNKNKTTHLGVTEEAVWASGMVLVMGATFHFRGEARGMRFPSEVAELSYAGVVLKGDWSDVPRLAQLLKDVIDARDVLDALALLNVTLEPVIKNGPRAGAAELYAELVSFVSERVTTTRVSRVEQH